MSCCSHFNLIFSHCDNVAAETVALLGTNATSFLQDWI